MTMLATTDTMSFDPSYQEPAIIREVESASAFSALPVPTRHWKTFIATNPQIDDDAHDLDAPSSLTDLMIKALEPRRAVSAELTARAKAAKAVYQAYLTRIEALKSDAALDNISLNKASEQDFWSFIKSSPFIKKGRLILMGNGNLRAAWKDEEGNHIGLQFLGNRLIQYVIFRHRAAGRISRVAGCDTQKGIELQIKTFDLKPLMYA